MRLRARSFALALLAFTFFTLGCGGDEEGGSVAPDVAITGDPGPIVMGLSRQYTAHVTWGVDSVVWSLPDWPTAGSIDQHGVYTAGLVGGTYPILARAIGDPQAVDTVRVTVVPFASFTPLGLKAVDVAVSSAGVIGTVDDSALAQFRNGGTTTSVTTHNYPVHIAFAPGGATAFVTSSYNKLFRIDVAAGQAVDTADFANPLYNLAVRPTDSLVYVAGSNGWLFKVQPGTLTKLDSVQLASSANGLGFTTGGEALWVSTISAGVLYKIDPATLTILDSFQLPAGLQRLAVAPSGDSIYVANPATDRLYIVRPSTRAVHALTFSSPHGVGISADGSRIVVAQLGQRVSVLSRTTMLVLGVVPVGGTPLSVAAAPDGSMLVSTTVDLARVQLP